MKVSAIQNVSSYTLLESPTRINLLLQVAQERGYESVALTDINVTYGLVKFYEEAQKIGIKPILGMQARVNGLIDSSQKFDMVVLAKNNQGYENILRLSSAINLLTENGTNNRVLTLENLTKYLTDVILITPANQKSELKWLYESNQELGSDFIRKIQCLLKNQNDSLYLGVYASEDQKDYIDYVSSLNKQFNIPLVALEDSEYLNPQDQFLKKVLQSIKSGTKLENVELLSKSKGSHYLQNVQELEERYHRFGLDEALKNTEKIAEDCNASITFKQPQLPKYKQNKFGTSKEYLKYLAQSGLNDRFHGKEIPTKYQKRLNYELQVINQMGFDDYFLIVWDVIDYCHRTGITTGPGRGSAAGSLVSYALKITGVDPIKYKLLFERFLNPARKQMPDIDLDIPDVKRDKVITYMFQKYGMDHVAQILTFGTLAAKQVIRDTARSFGLTAVEIDKWSNLIPSSKGKITLEESYQQSRNLQLLVNASNLNKLIFQTALALEGLPRHYSIHAAGLIVSDQSIAGISGLQAGPAPLNIPVTQQTKEYVESLGLLKIDFLGLRNLTILGNTLKLIESQGRKVDPEKIPLNDLQTLKLFQDGKTDAVFQFESNGIRRVLKKLHPDNFEDLVAVNALYRPGPMKNIDTFIARKHGEEEITYPDISLKPVLESTYGILVYQEQVMQTAQILAGFTLGEADILRRAMSKKNQDIIEQQKDKFIRGVVAKGHTQEVGKRVYNYIEQFANYGFNRSHAVAYTKIAFWLAYLKVHFPGAFFTAVLNSLGSNKSKVSDYVMQAKEFGVQINRPDINLSKLDYTLNHGKVIVGFRAVKGLRLDFSKTIPELPHPIKSFQDFLQKIDSKFLNQNNILPLIQAGCFDGTDANRNMLLTNCQTMIENIQMTGGNLSLSELLGVSLKNVKEISNSKKAEMEEAVLGFSVTTTPLEIAEKYAKRFDARRLSDFKDGDKGIAVGKLIKIKEIYTKKKEAMAFVTFADTSTKQEFTVFPKSYANFQKIMKNDQIYLIGLSVQTDRYDPNRLQFLLTNLKIMKFQK